MKALFFSKENGSFKQYITSKREKIGIKLYQHCTSNGILLDLMVYHGNLPQGLVMTEEGKDKGCHLFMDNFTLCCLWNNTFQNSKQAIGTIRDNRKHFPTKWKSLNVDKGAGAFNEHDGLVIVKYRAMKDTSTGKPKIVHVLSTAHTPAVGNSSKKDKEGNLVQKPPYIIAYNHNMGGAHMMDQQLDGIEVLRKMCKWCKKLFQMLVMQCTLTSYRLHKLNGGKDVFLYHFGCLYTPLLQCFKIEDQQ